MKISIIITLMLCACGADPVEPATEAAAGYQAQQMSCVQRFKTRADIDACRAKVVAAWAVDSGITDGGAE